MEIIPYYILYNVYIYIIDGHWVRSFGGFQLPCWKPWLLTRTPWLLVRSGFGDHGQLRSVGRCPAQVPGALRHAIAGGPCALEKTGRVDGKWWKNDGKWWKMLENHGKCWDGNRWNSPFYSPNVRLIWIFMVYSIRQIRSCPESRTPNASVGCGTLSQLPPRPGAWLTAELHRRGWWVRELSYLRDIRDI